MADTIFQVPNAPVNYDLAGKKVMVHDLAEPEATSTVLVDALDIATFLQKEKGEGVYYVSKNYVSASGATIVDLNTITSTDADYNTQLLAAKRGNILAPFPCPWSARNAALADLANGEIKSALIYVIAGEWTIGSDDDSKNGTDLNVAVFTTDIKIAQANNTVVASLLQNNLHYYFNKNTKLIYHNRTYLIYFGYHNDLTGPSFNSSVKGDGFFKQLFGEANGFNAFFIKIVNSRGKFYFEGNCELQQWENFTMDSVQEFTIDLKTSTFSDNQVVKLYDNDEGDGSPILGIIKGDNIKVGKGFLPFDSTDYWSAFGVRTCNTQRKNVTFLILKTYS